MLKKAITILIFMFGFISLSYGVTSGAMYDENVFDTIRVEESDIPEGFIYGKIPDFAKEVIKDNPWIMDRNAIDRLTKNIYPDGNSKAIKSLYVSILARENVPYGDDIVYYALVFRDSSSAKKEIKKLTEYSGFNKDRSIVLTKENVAVYIHVDDSADYSLIYTLAEKVKSKLQTM